MANPLKDSNHLLAESVHISERCDRQGVAPGVAHLPQSVEAGSESRLLREQTL